MAVSRRAQPERTSSRKKSSAAARNHAQSARKSRSTLSAESTEKAPSAGEPKSQERSLTAQTRALRARLRHPVLIVAGEHSGDLLAGDLVQAWKRPGGPSFYGTGGESMRRHGVEIIEDVDAMTAVGVVEALKSLRRLKALARRLVSLAVERETRTAILVDYPGFNLGLPGVRGMAAMLRAAIPDIFIIYLVSPQVWAWRSGHLERMRGNVDLMLTLYEFEKALYDREGIPAEWIGHPMINRIPLELKRVASVTPHRGLTLALMPGSRRSEVKFLLADMLQAARMLKAEHPRMRILLPFVDERLREFSAPFLEGASDLGVEISVGNSVAVLEKADLVFIASGTATLEAAFFRRPMVICYRVSWPNFLIGSALMRTKFIGLPNLLAREQVALELLQTEVTPEAIYTEGRRLLDKKEYARVVERLGTIPFSPRRKRPALLAVEAAEKALSLRG